MILVVDFGSQTAHLISRRLKELGSKTLLTSPEEALAMIKKIKPQGIIFSGGPSSVYEEGAPTIDRAIFDCKVPILGICYGLQLTAKLMGGNVISGKKEYGPVSIKLKTENGKLKIAKALPTEFTVWMSHGDEVVSMPKDFNVIAETPHVPYTFVENKKLHYYGVQFHPEVEHTEHGLQILKNFIEICGVSVKEHINDSKKIEKSIKQVVGSSFVMGAVSGGVDSTVAATLVANAIGKQFIPVFVDNGLMREGTADDINKIFSHIGISADIIDVKDEMLKRLTGVVDPESKRKIIGNFYIEVFENEMKRLIKSGKNVEFLVQGTIFSDVIESKGSKHASKIKSHHNVGGLPDTMKLKLIEPLREFYKDEVRKIGKELGLPEEFVQKQTFPGPGYAIRIRGEVTKKRLDQIKKADAIVLEELQKADLLAYVYMSFPIMSGASSTAVKGDGRFFGEVIALRIVESKDVMTSTWARLPYEVLQKISSRIINEVPGISRVVYDITTKPPATMEWE